MPKPDERIKKSKPGKGLKRMKHEITCKKREKEKNKQREAKDLPAPVSTTGCESLPSPGFTPSSSTLFSNGAYQVQGYGNAGNSSLFNLVPETHFAMSFYPYMGFEKNDGSSLLTPRQVLSCNYCPMKSDVAREVALHEVRYHCKRTLYGQDLLLVCYVPTCGWKCLQEEYLVLHILSFHRNAYLNRFENEELYQANLFNLTYLARLDHKRNLEPCGVKQLPCLPYDPSVETRGDGEQMNVSSGSSNRRSSSSSSVNLQEMAKVPKQENSPSKVSPISKRLSLIKIPVSERPSSKKYKVVVCKVESMGNDSGSNANTP